MGRGGGSTGRGGGRVVESAVTTEQWQRMQHAQRSAEAFLKEHERDETATMCRIPPHLPDIRRTANGNVYLEKAALDRWNTEWNEHRAYVRQHTADHASGKEKGPKTEPAAERRSGSEGGSRERAPRPPAVPNEMVERAQRFMMFAKDGGLASLKDVDLGGVDGISGKKTGNGMRAFSGKTTAELNRMSTDDFLTLTANKTQGDEATRTALLAGLRAGITTKPDQVKEFLQENGITVNGTDYAAAIDQYEQRVGGIRPPVAPVAPVVAPVAPEPEPAPYSGIQWEEDKRTTRLDRNDSWSFARPEGATAEDVRRIQESARISGNRVTYTLERQTDGLDDKSVEQEDRNWARDNWQDKRALDRGVLSFGDRGQLYITRVDAEFAQAEGQRDEQYPGLMRRRIDEYTSKNGAHQFAGLEFTPDGEHMTGRIHNAFHALSHQPGFKPEDGMLLRGNGYAVRVYQDGNEMKTVLVNPTDPKAVAAAGQTPNWMETEWKDSSAFNREERLRERLGNTDVPEGAASPGPQPRGTPPCKQEFETAARGACPAVVPGADAERERTAERDADPERRGPDVRVRIGVGVGVPL